MKYAEQDLIKGCQKNDRIWQERLYRTYFEKMFKMALYYAKDEEQAMGFLNLGFLRVFKKIFLCQQEESLEAWIRTTIRHVIISELKVEKSKRRHLSIQQEHVEIAQPDWDQWFEEDILNLLNKVPPSSARVFILYAQEGLTHKEIALRLNITEGTSKWHLNSAREQLKKLIETYYV